MKKLEDLYFEYNPEKDEESTRDFGHSIAEAIYKHFNYDSERVKKWILIQKFKQGLRKNSKYASD